MKINNVILIMVDNMAETNLSESEVLEELGLSQAETKIYLALLETGQSLAGPVIKKTGLHRGTTYQVLQRLKEKGVVSSIIRGKKQYFEAAPPDSLLDMLRQREELLRGIMPKLKEKMKSSREKQEVAVYSGVRGLRTVLDKVLDELTPNGEYYDFGVSGLFRTVMGPYWYIWQSRKKKSNIGAYVVFDEKVKENRQLLAEYVGNARFFPREFASVTDTMIYKDTVVLLVWTASPPIAIVIRNRKNAESFRNQFRLIWKNAEKDVKES
jgi:predicted transcriptional regulator